MMRISVDGKPVRGTMVIVVCIYVLLHDWCMNGASWGECMLHESLQYTF